jgi:NAD(P)-dependent dehydrogenase (short-subunit alcohol dehydrogenase family)
MGDVAREGTRSMNAQFQADSRTGDRLREAAAKVLTTARSRGELPGDVMFVAADATNTESCKTIADAVRKRLGGVDIVVHVVGG